MKRIVLVLAVLMMVMMLNAEEFRMKLGHYYEGNILTIGNGQITIEKKDGKIEVLDVDDISEISDLKSIAMLGRARDLTSRYTGLTEEEILTLSDREYEQYRMQQQQALLERMSKNVKGISNAMWGITLLSVAASLAIFLSAGA